MILQTGPFAVAPTASGLGELMGFDPEQRQRLEWQFAQRRAMDAIAGLTAVDGATIITADDGLLAFGVKLGRRDGSPPVERLLASEAVADSVPREVDASQIGGTRHSSAAQFVRDQGNAIALVASQDGRFTVFAWSPSDDRVRAHRIEILLL